MIEVFDPRNLKITGAYPTECFEATIYYLGYGRNAWQSTWINRYYEDCISFSIPELKSRAEKHRVQGSVFKIEAIPLFVLRYPKSTFGICAINDKPENSYLGLRKQIVGDIPQKFWHSLPSSASNWLLAISFNSETPEKNSFTPALLRSFSKGSKYRLGWNQSNVPSTGYIQFRSFADHVAKTLQLHPIHWK